MNSEALYSLRTVSPRASYLLPPVSGTLSPRTPSARYRQKVLFRASLMLMALPLLGWPGLSAVMLGQAFVNGAITVVVSDPAGASLPDASLTLTNIDTGATLTGKSNRSGVGQFVNLPPGNYRLQVELQGFKQLVRTPIVVEINNTVRLNLALQLGSVDQQVQVTAETPLLQPESSSLGQVIQERETNELPLNGRNPIALVELVPGVIPQVGAGQNPVTQNSFAPGNFQINGGAANESAAYWDGIPMNATGYLNELAIVPTQDALREFKVQTSNLSAEYDRFAGGIVSFITKSGSNAFHGETYEFIRNKVLNANNFFNNREGIANPEFTQNQFGGNLGGPIRKDKIFFFGSYDGFRLRQGVPYLFTVPTAQERNGDFSNLRDATGKLIPIYDPTTTKQVGTTYTRQQFPNNVIPVIDTTALALEKFWPLPNLAGAPFTNANNWAGNGSSGGNMNEYIGRVDYTISERQRVFGRYAYEDWTKFATNAFGTGVVVPSTGQGPNNNVNQQVALDDTFVFSPNLVGDLAIGYLRSYLSVFPEVNGLDLSTLGPGWAGLQNQVSVATIPGINLTQITAWGSTTGAVIKEYTNDYDLLPSISWIKGHHTIKFGGDYRLSQLNYGQAGGVGGNFTFSSSFTASSPVTSAGGFDFASYLLGDAASGTITTLNFIAAQKFYLGVYAQDDWKVTPSFTLNVGLRYSYDSAFTERHNRISTFLQNASNPLASETGAPVTGELALVDTPQRPSRTGFNAFPRAFAPRFGFGYQADPKTVVRGAYGIFWLPNILTSGPYIPQSDPINQYSTTMVSTLNGGITPYNHLSNPFPGGITKAPGRAANINSYFYGLGPSVEVPNNPYAYAQQWNLDIQRQLPGQVFIDAAYVGAKGTHLPIGGFQMDQLPLQDMSQGAALLNQVPNPFYNLSTPFNGSLSGPTISAGQLLLPYPQYNGLTINPLNVGMSSFNSFQLKVQRNFSLGQTILLTYAASKNMNNGAETQTSFLNSTAGIQNWYNLAGEYSLSTFDVSQRMVVSYVLDLPVGQGKRLLGSAHGIVGAVVSGWGTDAIWTAQKGTPLGFATSSNVTGSLHGGSRPNFDTAACPNGAGVSGSKNQRVVSGWFNTACFTQPAPYTFGNTGRTSGNLRTDGTDTVDAALFKNTKFLKDGAANLQFRAEAFNLFNTPVFGAPNTTLGAVGFGTVSSQYNNPRLVQFGLKVGF
jgi:Carboxypeptidase regulatory-like domain/TonB dependent receptor